MFSHQAQGPKRDEPPSTSCPAPCRQWAVAWPCTPRCWPSRDAETRPLPLHRAAGGIPGCHLQPGWHVVNSARGNNSLLHSPHRSNIWRHLAPPLANAYLSVRSLFPKSKISPAHRPQNRTSSFFEPVPQCKHQAVFACIHTGGGWVNSQYGRDNECGSCQALQCLNAISTHG